jgi:hypothetical protein
MCTTIPTGLLLLIDFSPQVLMILLFVAYKNKLLRYTIEQMDEQL